MCFSSLSVSRNGESQVIIPVKMIIEETLKTTKYLDETTLIKNRRIELSLENRQRALSDVS